MAPNVLDSILSRDSFGTPAMCAVFGDRGLIHKYVKVEVALVRVQARRGMIPEAATQGITEKRSTDAPDSGLLHHEAEIMGYPILSLVRQISKRTGESGGYVYWGATTQDIMDTAVVLQIRDAFALIESDMDRLRAALTDLSRRYRDTPVARRTHLQQALPITFGYKIAIWLNMLECHARRLIRTHPHVLVGEFAGAADTLTSLGDKDLAIQKAMMKELGLNVPTSTWHIAHGGFAEAVNLLAVITGSLDKIVYGVMLLAASEFGELYKPLVKGRDASSTMPRKRNPISSELMLACAKDVHQQTGLILDAMVQDLERATGSWHAEWIAVPESFVLSAGTLRQANFMLAGLVTDKETMKRNLGITNGLIVAEAIMTGLTPYTDRQDAHDVVYGTCRIVNEQGGRLADVLNAMPSVSKRLGPQLIGKLADPANYLGIAPAMMDRVLARYMSQK